MIVRPAVEADHDAIMELQHRYDRLALNPYEPVNGPVFVAEEDGKIVAVAIARRTVEAFLAVDPAMSNYRKARAVRMLTDIGAKSVKQLGYCEFHILTHDEKFAELAHGLKGAQRDTRTHLWVDVTGDV